MSFQHTTKFYHVDNATYMLIESDVALSSLDRLCCCFRISSFHIHVHVFLSFKSSPQELELSRRKCEGGAVAYVEQLLHDFGPDAVFNARDNNGFSCLFRAAQKNQKALVHFLIEKGVDVNQRSRKGETPIFGAGIDVIDTLLDAGANIEAKDDANWTPLHHEARWCSTFWDKDSPRKLQMLIDRGANIEALTDKGETPLRLAIVYEVPQAIPILSKNGASMTKAKQSTHNQSMWDRAMERNDIKAAIAEGIRLAQSHKKRT